MDSFERRPMTLRQLKPGTLARDLTTGCLVEVTKPVRINFDALRAEFEVRDLLSGLIYGQDPLKLEKVSPLRALAEQSADA